MAKDFEWDYAAAGDLLLKSEEIANVCEEEAARLTRATGMEYVANVTMLNTRVAASAYDSMSGEDGSYRRRKGKNSYYYTQRKLEKST